MTADLIWILLAFMLGGWIQGMIGFGFAVATTLLLIHQMDFTTLVFLNLCMSFLTCLIAMLSVRNLKAIHRPTLLRLLISASAGLALGVVMLHNVDALLLKRVALWIILSASVLSLTRTGRFFSHRYLSWAAGFVSGVLTPSTGINGPFVALHLKAAFADKQQTRNMMLAYLLVVMLAGIVLMSFQSNLPGQTWSRFPDVVIPALAGYGLGMWSFRKLPNRFFAGTVTFFLIASSLLSLIYLTL